MKLKLQNRVYALPFFVLLAASLTFCGKETLVGRAQPEPQQVPLAPTITQVTPAQGPITGGTSVTITGSNFDLNKTTVSFGAGKGTITAVTATTIVVTTPPALVGAGPVTVTVTTPGGAAMAINVFTYVSGGK